jgi:hypothetical protein
LNLGLVAIFTLAATNIISIPLVAYAVSQYASDGFTIFPTKSSDYMSDFCHKTECIYKTIKFKASIQFAINYGPGSKLSNLRDEIQKQGFDKYSHEERGDFTFIEAREL